MKPRSKETRKRASFFAPLGTIVTRKHNKNLTRWIKISLDDPNHHKRWKLYAHYIWEKAHGPVKPKYRVGHLDGDTMNDDPANLAAMTLSDISAHWHIRNPEKSDAFYARKRTARFRFKCKKSAKVRRLADSERRVFTDRWYPVDVARGVIVNRPFLTRKALYAAYGIALDIDPATGRDNGLSPAFGWRGLDFLWVCILAVLVEKGGRRTISDIETDVGMLRDLHGGDSYFSASSLSTAFYELRKRGYIESERNGPGKTLYWATNRARTERGRVAKVVAVLGRRLVDSRFADWPRITPGSDGQRHARGRTCSDKEWSKIHAAHMEAHDAEVEHFARLEAASAAAPDRRLALIAERRTFLDRCYYDLEPGERRQPIDAIMRREKWGGPLAPVDRVLCC